MRHVSVCALVAGLMLTGGSVQARDGQDRYQIFGAGLHPCSTALAAARDPAAMRVLETWMAGYLTAANYAEPDTYNILGDLAPGRFVPELLHVCRGDPTLNLAGAMVALIQRRFAERIKSGP